MKEKELTDKQIIAAERADREIIAEREKEISQGLMRFHGRTRYDLCTEETPAHLAAAREGMPLDELVSGEGGYEWEIRNETIRTFFRYVAQDGLHPADVLKRLYAIGLHMRIEPFCQITLREKQLIFGDSHESHRWLMKRICIAPLQRAGAKSVKAPGQKGAAASIAASKAQQGNSNRVGGKSAARNRQKKTRKPTL